MKKKKLVLSIYLIATISVVFLCTITFNITPPDTAYANSAYVPPNNHFDISVNSDGSDISVIEEVLTFDFFKGNSYNYATVTADYTMDSPSNKTVALGFPLVSSLLALENNISIKMNNDNLDYEVFLLHGNGGNDNIYNSPSGEGQIYRNFANMTFEEQLEAAVPKSYRSKYAEINGWLYKIADNYFGKITSLETETVLQFGNFVESTRGNSKSTWTVSGGGYIFSPERLVDISGIRATEYTEQNMSLLEFQKLIFPVDYFADVSFLFDKLCMQYTYNDQLKGCYISINPILDSFFTRNQPMMLVYNAPFIAGTNNMIVSYKINANIQNQTARIGYYSNPAKVWSNFGKLTVRIDTFYYVLDSNIPLKKHKLERPYDYVYTHNTITEMREFNRYEYIGDLPDQNIIFTSSMNQGGAPMQPLIILGIVVICVFVVFLTLLILLLVFATKYKRIKKDTQSNEA